MKRILRSLIALLAAWPVVAQGQQARALSIDDALRLAESQSEAVRIAQAGVQRARGQQMQARSQYMPQVGASLTYTRTLASQFEALASSGSPTPPTGTPPVPPDDGLTYYSPCTRYLAPAGSTDAVRLAGLEAAAKCASGSGGGIDFSKVGFGAANQYQLGLQGSISLYTGGRAQSQNRVAEAARSTAEIELGSQRAKLALDVTEAYFDAVLADRLVAIAESSLVQTEGVLGQTKLARQVGNQSEFELLRAQVTRDNQMPVLLQRRTDRNLAYLRLKQILNLPFAQTVSLSTQLADEKELPTMLRTVASTSGVGTADTSTSARAPVRQVTEALKASQQQLRIAKSEWLPTVSLTSSYGRVAFPKGGLPDLSSFLTNWTVGVTASFPLFTGGRIKGGTMMADASVREAQARLDQTRELASLDAQQAAAQLEQAQAALAASMGTTEQASRAYTIADVRFREGLSTQIELNDSRLLLQQASANRAQAIRNLQVARMRVALLRDLPTGAGASAGGGFTGGASQQIAPGGGGASSGGAAAAGGAVRTSGTGGPGGPGL